MRMRRKQARKNTRLSPWPGRAKRQRRRSGGRSPVNRPAGIAVDSEGFTYLADTGNHTIRKGIPPWPAQMVVEPKDQAGLIGHRATFEVLAAGKAPLSFQWRKDGVDLFDGGPISGTTGAKLSIEDLKWQDVGVYQVVVSNALGVAASHRAVLTLREAAAGEVLRTRRLAEPDMSRSAATSPAVSGDGAIHVGTTQGLACVEADSGLLKWRYQAGLIGFTSPSIGSDGTVYAGYLGYISYRGGYWYSPGGLVALDGNSGALKWSQEIPGPMTPAVGENKTIYVASGRALDAVLQGPLVALDSVTGDITWKSVETRAPPVLGLDGTVYLVTEPVGNSELAALIGTTGLREWTFRKTFPIRLAPAIGPDGTLYLATSRNFSAIDELTSAEKWSPALPPDQIAAGTWELCSPAVDAEGTVFFGWGRSIYAVDVEAKVKKWEYVNAGDVVATPAVGADGTQFVGSTDSKIYAVDCRSGAKKWEVPTGRPLRGSPVLSGTVLHVNSDDGVLYAIEARTELADSPWPMYMHDPQHTGRATAPVTTLKFSAITVSNGQLRLQWTGNGVLQTGERVTGPWTDVVTTTASFSTAPTGAHRFYRLRSK